MMRTIQAVLEVLRACFGSRRDLEILMDERTLEYAVFCGKRELFRASSLWRCWDYIADRFYRWGYDFTVQGLPGDCWVESLFYSERLDPAHYQFMWR